MNKNVVYSLLAVAAPAAMVQAAVDVPLQFEAQTAQQAGDVYKTSVNFGTLVPGTYTLTGFVTPYATGMKATMAGTEWQLPNASFSKTIIIAETTENVTLEITGPTEFTLMAYQLKLEWNLDKTAWDALISNVSGKLTTYGDHISAEKKTEFEGQLTDQQEAIDALTDGYDTYAAQELWKLSDGGDKISVAINGIGTNIDNQIIEDCWATKQAAYNSAIAELPSEANLTALSNSINELEINQDKRQQSYATLKEDVSTYTQEASTALGDKPTTVEDATANVWAFNPTVAANDITTAYNLLNGYVNTDIANYTRYQTMTNRVETANNNVGNIDTNKTKNLSRRQENAEEKAEIQEALTTYSSEAETAYNTAIAADGAVFGYDGEFADLEEIESRITALSTQITEDNEAYLETYNTIKGYISAGQTYYSQLTTALSENIPEAELQNIVETAQGQLYGKSQALTNMGSGYATAYNDGDDLNASAAETAVNDIKAEMDAIVTAANEEAQAEREAKQAKADATAAALAAIDAATAQLAAANTEIDAYNDNEDYGTPSSYWTAEYAAIGAEIAALTSKVKNAEDIIAYYDDGNGEFATDLAAITGNSIATYIATAKEAIDLYKGFHTYFYTTCQNQLNTLEGRVKGTATGYTYNPIYDDEEVLFTATTNYKAIIANLQAIIDNAKQAAIDVTKLTGSAHLEELQSMCKKDNKNNVYANYYTGYSITVNGVTDSRGNTTGLLQTINYYINGDPGTGKHGFSISKLRTIYNETAFANYKTTKKAEVEALGQTGDDATTTAIITGVTTAIDELAYDEEKTLAENEAAVDAKIPADLQTQIDEARAEATATSLVGFLNDQVISRQTALLDAIKDSKDDVTDKMGTAEETIQGKYTALIEDVTAIETSRAIIEAATIGEDNDYNTNVKKMNAYNGLLEQIGKSTDEASAEGNLYAKYKALDTEAKAAKDAKTANDEAYTTLNEELTGFTTTLNTYLDGDTYTAYSEWTKQQVADDVTSIQDMISTDTQTLNTANTAQKLTAQSTNAHKSEIADGIANLKTKAVQKESQWTANENRYNTLKDEFDADVEGSLQSDLNSAQQQIGADYPDVAASFTATITEIQNKIDASKTALETAHTNVQLTANSDIENRQEIEKDIEALIPAAEAKQAKYTANQTLTTKYNEVNLALIEQRAQVLAAAAAANDNSDAAQAAKAFYRNKFNGEGGFAAQLADIKSQIDEQFGATDVDATAYAKLENDLTDLQTAFNKVLPEATANKAAYDDQIEAYNTAKGKYDEIYTAITDPNNYIQEYVQDEIADMEAYSPEDGGLKSALTTIETNYGAGEAANKQQTNLATLNDITKHIEAIIETLDGDGDTSYAADIRATNEAVMQTVEKEIANIMPAYSAAYNVINEYTSAKDPDLNATITQAAATLNAALAGTVQQRNTFTATANTEMAENNTAKTEWDATELIEQIQDYIAGLDDVKQQFLDDIQGAIVNYWQGIKENRKGFITDAFNTLEENGYIDGEIDADIFEDNYETIAQGDDIVYNTDEVSTELEPRDIISITALDALVYGTDNNGDLYPSVFSQAVEKTATSFAKAFVKEQLATYTTAETGKKATDWDAIVAIFGNHDVDYGKPANTDGAQKQFNDIVDETLTVAENTAITYETPYSTISNLLTEYDEQVDELKTTVQGWVTNQEAADAALAQAIEDLQTLQTELRTAANAAETTFKTLKEKVNMTSVAANYAADLENIEWKIEAAQNTADTPPSSQTQSAVNQVTDMVNYHLGIITGTVPTQMTNVENGVIADLKNDLSGLIPELQTQFNAYAASSSADQTKVDDWNSRIQDAIAKTANNYQATLDEMVALEDDIAKLRTEMGDISGDMTETIAGFKARLQTLQNAALDDKDYGNKANDFANTLSTIKTAASALAGEVEQHETAGDIAPYVDNIEGRIAAQEAEWTTLQANAAAQAEKVATNKATVADLNNRIAVLEAAELTGEYSQEMTNYFAIELQTIKENAASYKNAIAQNADEIQNFLGGEDGFDTHIATLENQWAQLQADAEEAAADWAAQKQLSNDVYDTLSKLLDEVEDVISNAKTTIGGYSYSNVQTQQNNIADVEANFNNAKAEIEEGKEGYWLDEANQDNYQYDLNLYKTQATNYLNAAAKSEALYQYSGNENGELLTAQKAAWNAFYDWTFASTVKSTVQETLNSNQNAWSDLLTEINSDATVYDHWQTYAKRAAEIIGAYNGVVATIEGYSNYMFGDADQNGKLNVLDYQKMANMILNSTLQPAATDKLFQALDINQNEVIEVGDLTALVNYLLNANWQGFAFARAMNTDGEHLAMTTSQTQQGTQRIALTLDNVNSYTAFQLDVVLPEGMTIVGTQLGDRAAQSHRLMSRKQEDGSMRLLASSIKGDTFEGNNGAVLYIDVQTNADYMGGSAQLQNILFADVNAQTRSFTIGSETTGIDTMTTFEQLKQKVYDLGGRMKEGLKKGINIIRRADGKTEKVVK